jgi:hypothetical protein
MKTIFVLFTLFILILASAFVIFRERIISSNIQEDEKTITENLVGNDRDEHGCIASAGYTWCEPKQICLRLWEEPCVDPAAADETEVIINTIKQAIIEKRGESASALTYRITRVEGDYATGSASSEHGGGMWFAAKGNGQWQLVWDGNGIITCTEIEPFPSFPTSFIPECYDETSGSLLTR